MEHILNLSKIREILSGEEAEIQEIIYMLGETIPDFVEKVEKYVMEEDVERLKFTIHKFKSSCQLITEHNFIEHIRAIERADPFDFNQITPQIQEMIRSTLLLEKEIKEYQQAA